MNKKALVLALTTALATPVVTMAATGYDGGKLSTHLGPTYQTQTIDQAAQQTPKEKVYPEEKTGTVPVKSQKATPNKKKEKTEKKGTKTETVGPLPVVLYGDEVIYHQETGEFEATGKVRVYQGQQKLYTTKVEGNINSGDVYLREGGRLVEGDTTTKGKIMHYNFLTKEGKVQSMEGTNGKDLYTAPEAQIYPDRMEMSQGAMTTRCVAVEHTHCFEVKADKVIIYPNDKIIAYNVKVYVKGKHIYSRDRWINDLTKTRNRNSMFPSIGYSKKHGTEIKYNYDQVLSDKNVATAELKYYSKIGWRPLFYDVQDERNFYVRIQNGHTEDNDNNWIKKERDVTIGYKPHKFTKKLPLNYSAYASHGLWSDQYNTSWHSEVGFFISHDRINFGTHNPLHLDLGTGYKITKESINDSTTRTMLYSATLGKPWDGGWNSWLGYYWQKNQNNLFAYNNPDMARELQFGLSKQFDRSNALSWLARYDEGKSSMYEYVWRYTHDFCCWRVTLEYRDKKYNEEKEWSINYDLYRW